MSRTPVLKTYKLYINGQFPRSESGHSYQAIAAKTKKPIANMSLASRKDLRDAVKAAHSAFDSWNKKTAYNRAQILYRIAEMLEARSAEFCELIELATGCSKSDARKEVELSCDRLIWYAGWSDKYQQVFGSVNPVALPYFNFTTPDAMGVVGIAASEELSLLPLISTLAPTIVSGNTCVVLASERYPAAAIAFAEVLQTSDVPAGVVNLLTGNKSELIEQMSTHMNVNAMLYAHKDEELLQKVQLNSVENLKRIITRKAQGKSWFQDAAQSPYFITDLTEMKTTWHPIGV